MQLTWKSWRHFRSFCSRISVLTVYIFTETMLAIIWLVLSRSTFLLSALCSDIRILWLSFGPQSTFWTVIACQLIDVLLAFLHRWRLISSEISTLMKTSCCARRSISEHNQLFELFELLKHTNWSMPGLIFFTGNSKCPRRFRPWWQCLLVHGAQFQTRNP